MEVDKFERRWHGLHALQQYLIECVDSEGLDARTEEVYDLIVASAELVRDSGGDMKKYVDEVCDAFPVNDEVIRQALRDELWTKLLR